MNNIFENATFGDKFRRRDGKMALFINGDYKDSIDNEIVYQVIQDDNLYFCYADGLANKQIIDNPKDIVGHWEEPIDEEKLDKIFVDYISSERRKCGYDKDACTAISVDNVWLEEGFKEGYKMALKQ